MPDMEDVPYVVYYMPDGSEISDDPRWKSDQFKNQLMRQDANLKAEADFAAARQAEDFAKANGQAEESEDDSEEDDEEDDSPDDLSGKSVADLKELAEENQVDLAGVKRKSELLVRLREAGVTG